MQGPTVLARNTSEKTPTKKLLISDATMPSKSLAGMSEHPHHAWHRLCSAASERPPGRLQERLHGRLQGRLQERLRFTNKSRRRWRVPG